MTRTVPGRRGTTGGAPLAGIETSGFDQFFREAWPDAFRLAAFLTHDRTASEEISQDAFAQMYARRADTPPAYLRTTIVNRCANWRRHARVHRAKLPLLVTTGVAELGFDDLGRCGRRPPLPPAGRRRAPLPRGPVGVRERRDARLPARNREVARLPGPMAPGSASVTFTGAQARRRAGRG